MGISLPVARKTQGGLELRFICPMVCRDRDNAWNAMGFRISASCFAGCCVRNDCAFGFVPWFHRYGVYTNRVSRVGKAKPIGRRDSLPLPPWRGQALTLSARGRKSVLSCLYGCSNSSSDMGIVSELLMTEFRLFDSWFARSRLLSGFLAATSCVVPHVVWFIRSIAYGGFRSVCA